MTARLKLSFHLVALLMMTRDSLAQNVRSDVGLRLLIPSSVRSTTFTSSLTVLNMDVQPNTVVIRARREDGSLVGEKVTTIPVGGRFRSTNILGELGAALGEFGPLTVESTNGRLLSAVSEVVSNQGPGGFFPGVNIETAWLQGFLLDLVDSGDFGNPGSSRTNIDINTVGSQSANATITLFDNSGTPLGSTNTTVPGNGMRQLNSIIRTLLNSSGNVTGQNGHLKVVSNLPILAWASKIENGSGDPSFQIGIQLATVPQVQTISVSAIANIALAGQPAGTVVDFDSSPTNSPVPIPFGITSGQVLHFGATGTVTTASSGPPISSTADGDLGSSAFSDQALGLSSVRGPRGSLIGVFLGQGAPNPTATPPSLDFSGAARDLVTLNPLLHQPFYIGAGRVASGGIKNFVVPFGATRLFLGVLDFANRDNSGSFQVTISTP